MRGKVLILLIFGWLGCFGQVPDTNTFSLQDVVNIVGGTSLTEAFTNSVDALFDPAYKGSKDRLSNFRNYGTYGATSGNGKLYNLYATNNSSPISASGWHVPTSTEYATLLSQLGGGSAAGGHMKQVGYIYWSSPNTGADNSSGWNGKGSAGRVANTGEFVNITYVTTYLTSSYNTPPYAWCPTILYNTASISFGNTSPKQGLSVRLIKDDSTLATYTGNDGQTYTTVKIGTQVWMSQNLKETKYRDGSLIPNVTSASSWIALTTGAWCWYNNVSSYE